jgi:hypothetical protein
MKAKILKKLVANGETLLPNEIVDVSEWKNAQALESNRYIQFIIESFETPTKETKTKASAVKVEA